MKIILLTSFLISLHLRKRFGKRKRFKAIRTSTDPNDINSMEGKACVIQVYTTCVGFSPPVGLTVCNLFPAELMMCRKPI